MAWSKAPEQLVELFATIVPDNPEVERRKMFGFPAAFVHGYLFAGTHQHSLLIRLPEEQYETFLALPGAAPFEPMPGRPMRGFAVFPEAMLAEPETLRQWVLTAFESAAALPLKAPKAPKARARPKKNA